MGKKSSGRGAQSGVEVGKNVATSSLSGGKEIRLHDIVGGGYGAFWRFKGPYRAVKGSRASKKSKTMCIESIVKMMKHPGANLLVVRKTFRTLKDSCYTDLKWAIARLGVGAYWKATLSPLQLEYLPTGQRIYFRGLDDPLKITSITVEHGALCWLWIEEAYEIVSESDFDTLNESIRGQVEEGLYKQTTLTFNPWSEKSWLKARFFDVESPEIFAMTTNYLCNEWLDEADLKKFQLMKENNPKRYEVAGLGHWGIEDGTIFMREWLSKRFRELPSGCQMIQTWDLPFKKSENSAKCAGIVMARKGAEIFIFDCINEKMNFTETVAAVKSLSDKHPTARAKVIEDKANGPALIDFLKKEVSGLVGFHPRGSKEERALAVTPYFEAGNVYFLEGASWVHDLVGDLAEFPHGIYKDTVDAVVQGILYLMDKPVAKLGKNNLTKDSSFLGRF